MPAILFDIARLEPYIQSGHTLLTPNLRLARRIKSEWDEQQRARGERVWQPLPVRPLEHWLLDQWRIAIQQNLLPSLLPLNRQQELQLWEQVIDDSRLPFTLLRPAAAAELASTARDTLLRWGVEMTPQLRAQFRLETDCAVFLDWMERFERRLHAASLCTTADSLRALARVAPQLPAARLCLVECFDISPLARDCLRGFCGEPDILPPTTRLARCVAHPFADQRSELEGVAAWAAQLHREDPAATLGIVLADTGRSRVALEYLLRREFDCLGKNYQSLPVNFSTGIALSHAPVVRDALAVLAMSPTNASIDVKDVLALLHSRFLDLPDRDGVPAQHFIRRLHEHGSASLSLARLRDIATDPALTGADGWRLGKVLLAISGMRSLRSKAPPSTWVVHFTDVLAEWGWPGSESLDSLEFQQVKRWYDTLDEFRALDEVWPSVDCAQALHLLCEGCAQQVSQPQTADAPVQVLGPLEAVGLSFDHLWVTGMQGGAWPAAARPNPFVPLLLQARLEMPHATPEREWDYSEQLLQHYQRNCSWVHASYSRELDGVVDLPSALIEGFSVTEPAVGATLSSRWLDACLNATRESIDDSRAPPLPEPERDALRGGSALLEHQSQCPFRGFAQHRLQVEPLAEFRPGVLPPERGKLVHEALQLLWNELGDHGSLLAAPPAALEDLIERATRHGISTLAPARRYSLGPACIELESDRLRQLLSQWLDVERARGSFIILALEQQVELVLRGLRIRLRIDRMDELDDGSRVVIDYKTGRASVNDWIGERPRRPQLLLYGLASEAPPAALAFAMLRPRESAYVGLGNVESIPGVKTDIAKAVKGAQPAEDWATLNAAWRVSLEQLAQGFIDGDAAVDPLKHSCTWCGLQSLCRVDTLTPDFAEDELDDSAESDAWSGWSE